LFVCLFFWGVGWSLNSVLHSYKSRWSTTWAMPPVHFALVILEMWVLQTIFPGWPQTQSSLSQSPKYLGLQVWSTSAWKITVFHMMKVIGFCTSLCMLYFKKNYLGLGV
jgi:hypothetical protein